MPKAAAIPHAITITDLRTLNASGIQILRRAAYISTPTRESTALFVMLEDVTSTFEVLDIMLVKSEGTPLS